MRSSSSSSASLRQVAAELLEQLDRARRDASSARLRRTAAYIDPPHDHRQATQGESHRRPGSDRPGTPPAAPSRGSSERIANAPRRLDLYFDIADPWSYLDGAGGQPAGRGVPGRARGPRRHAAGLRRRPGARRCAPKHARPRRPAARRVLGPRVPRQEGSRRRDGPRHRHRADPRAARRASSCAPRSSSAGAMWANDKAARRRCSASGAPSRTARSRRSSTRPTPSSARPATTRAR